MTPDQKRAEFERVWPWLEQAVQRYADTASKDDVWERIEDGRADLWTTPNAAMVTTIEVYPTGFKELRGWLAGGELSEIVQAEPILADWAKHQGCNRVVILGRRGWLRAFDGYRETAVLMTKDI